MTAKARSGRTIVVGKRIYRIAQPDAVKTSGGMRLAPKPHDWAKCRGCGQILNRHNMAQHQTDRHLRIHNKCAKCGKTRSFKTVSSFIRKLVEDKDGNESLVTMSIQTPLCCASTCINCKSDLSDTTKRRCNSCDLRYDLSHKVLTGYGTKNWCYEKTLLAKMGATPEVLAFINRHH